MYKINDNISFDLEQEWVLISGPCVIEDGEKTFETAQFLKKLTGKLNIPFIFKASYDKANRTSISSFRGPGQSEGLRILQEIKNQLNIPVLSDVHTAEQVGAASEILDIIQIPAFLCRQTDLIIEVSKSGCPVNIKKGQFLAPWDIQNIVEKIRSAGNDRILITERGTMFGYNNLVVDFRGIPIMQQTGCPIIFDATHSIQLPGGAGKSSGGQREYAPLMANAAMASGTNGIFMEVHKDPDKALCDGPNSLKLDSLEFVLRQLNSIKKALISK